MDPSGCPDPLWVTDNVFAPHLGQTCETPILGWTLSVVVLFLVRAHVTIRIWRSWCLRRKQQLKKKLITKRWPIVPILTTAFLILNFFIVILVATNKANVFNGGAVAIYCAMCFCWGIFSLFFLKKYVRAARHLVPIALAHSPTVFSSVSDSGNKAVTIEARIKLLNTFDIMLQSLVGMQVISLVVLLICGTILLPSDPQNRVYFKLSMGFIGCFGLLLMIAMIHQSERLVQATLYSVSQFAPMQHSDETIKALAVVRNLRIGQGVWFITGSLTFIPHVLIATETLNPHWYVIYFLLCIETIASTFAFYTRPKQSKASEQLTVPS